MKHIIIAGFLIINYAAHCQEDEWANWDANYAEVDIAKLFEYEVAYADSIDNDSSAIKFYARQKGYRFEGIFTGNTRTLSEDRRMAMKSVYKLHRGEHEIFDSIEIEIELIVHGERVLWMPIQKQIESYFKEEIGDQESVYLYCTFFNKHEPNGKLYNLFLISEFR